MNTNPYQQYKPTAASSMSQIPTHWEARQLGQIGVFAKGAGGNKDDEAEHGLPCIRYGDIYTSYKYHARQTRSYINPDVAPHYARIEHGHALFAGSGETIEEIGKSVVNLMTQEAYCGGDVILFKPKVEIHPTYLGYVLDCLPVAYQKSRMGRGITIMHIYSSQLKYLTIPLPPLEEQTAIVRYLDRADDLINRYISAKERLIALLEEQRQAVIHQAVTRGLDPDVPLKPSHVTNVPLMPAHWDVKRLKSMSHIRYGLGQPPRESPNGLPLIRATNVSRGHITENAMMYVDPYDVPTTRDAFLRENEIIVVRSGAYTADSAIIPKRYEGAISGYDMVVAATEANPEFLAMALLSTYVRDDQLIVVSNRAAQPHLNAEELGDAKILTPPRLEQEAIVNYLRHRLTEAATAKEWAHRQIDLMARVPHPPHRRRRHRPNRRLRRHSRTARLAPLQCRHRARQPPHADH